MFIIQTAKVQQIMHICKFLLEKLTFLFISFAQLQFFLYLCSVFTNIARFYENSIDRLRQNGSYD